MTIELTPEEAQILSGLIELGAKNFLREASSLQQKVQLAARSNPVPDNATEEPKTPPGS